MGNFVEFDHFDVADDLDVASWDNYPLGFLTRDGTDEADQQTYLRTGHPDSSSFHHDLYRSCGKGRLWLMEQQPGPVNWAPFNPSPLPGMVRLWGWEAFAHGAEVVSYFRYRQAPFAQEQMHAGLCLPDGTEDDAALEVKTLSEEIKLLAGIDAQMQHASVALIFDYAGDQAARIQQPELDNYKLIVLANCCVSDTALADTLARSDAQVIMFPRTGSKTTECSIPDQLPPGVFQNLINIKVTRVETLPASTEMVTNNNAVVVDWRERVDADFPAQDLFEDGWGFHYRTQRVHYINACPERQTLLQLLAARLQECNIPCVDLGPGLRVAVRGKLVMAFNYGPDNVTLSNEVLTHYGFEESSGFALGQQTLSVSGISAWCAK